MSGKQEKQDKKEKEKKEPPTKKQKVGSNPPPPPGRKCKRFLCQNVVCETSVFCCTRCFEIYRRGRMLLYECTFGMKYEGKNAYRKRILKSSKNSSANPANGVFAREFLEVDLSRVHVGGWGVYAKKDFTRDDVEKKNAPINYVGVQYTGESINAFNDLKCRVPYAFAFTKDFIVDATVRGDFTSLINSDRTNYNLEFKNTGTLKMRDKVKVIKQGSELLIYYGKQYTNTAQVLWTRRYSADLACIRNFSVTSKTCGPTMDRDKFNFLSNIGDGVLLQYTYSSRGYSLFADRFFPKGYFITEYDGTGYFDVIQKEDSKNHEDSAWFLPTLPSRQFIVGVRSDKELPATGWAGGSFANTYTNLSFANAVFIKG